jgi:predicted nuclease of predicted toxin-antitoxin system
MELQLQNELVIDMNLSPVWAQVLQSAGLEAVHRSDFGAPDAEDAEIMVHARRAGCVVLTHDLDFGTLLAHSKDTGPSVVQIRTQDVSPHSLAPTLVSALHQYEEMLNRGALMTIRPDRAKVRILPL